MSTFATLLQAVFGAVQKEVGNGSSLSTTIKSVVRYPIKTIATFFTAPILILRLALTVKNPIRRLIAVVGLFISILLAYLAGTFLGSLVGALFMLTHFGPIIAAGFFFGTALSVMLSVAFMLFIFNATSWFFLHMSAEDVVEHLLDISK